MGDRQLAVALGRALAASGELFVEEGVDLLSGIGIFELSRAIAQGTVIYTHSAKRVVVVRFSPPSGGKPLIAKATWLDDADPRAETLGALVCAEMRAYKLLQSGGARHPNVGTLSAVVWTAGGGEGGEEAAAAAQAGSSSGGAGDEATMSSGIEAQHRQQQQSGACSDKVQGSPAAAAGSYVVLIQPFYGSQTLDAHVCARIASDRRRMAPGSLEFERMLLPVLEGTARAIAFSHQRGLILRDFKPGNILIDCAGPTGHPGPTSRHYSADAGSILQQQQQPLPVMIDFDGAAPMGAQELAAIAAEAQAAQASWAGSGQQEQQQQEGAAGGSGSDAAAAAAEQEEALAQIALPTEFTFTPPYVAPEVARAAIELSPPAAPRVSAAAMAHASAKSDVFSFGVAAWQLAHAEADSIPYPFARGDPTFTHDAEWIHAVAEDAVPVNPLLSPPLLRLIGACLEKDPAKRPSSVRVLQLIDEWRTLLEACPAAASGVGATAAAAVTPRGSTGGVLVARHARVSGVAPSAGDGATGPAPRQEGSFSANKAAGSSPAHQRPGAAASCVDHAPSSGAVADALAAPAAATVVVSPEQIALDQWRYLGPGGAPHGPVSSAELLSAYKRGRIGGVAPVEVWSAGGSSGGPVAVVPLATLAPLLTAGGGGSSGGGIARGRQPPSRVQWLGRLWPAAPGRLGRSGAAYVAPPAAPQPKGEPLRPPCGQEEDPSPKWRPSRGVASPGRFVTCCWRPRTVSSDADEDGTVVVAAITVRKAQSGLPQSNAPQGAGQSNGADCGRCGSCAAMPAAISAAAAHVCAREASWGSGKAQERVTPAGSSSRGTGSPAEPVV